MTHVQLKNAGVLVNDEVDFGRTAVQQIASQRIRKNLYRQVFKIVFHLKNGRLIQAIAVSDASKEECSMSDVTVYRISAPLLNESAKGRHQMLADGRTSNW
ncbi:hypothetical protein [Methylobacterium trifolii]|uniref:Uncharacterized protein n=1 Tax=Methylobacterium trifolii TaxID=1003092 RepID=A0ABQ4U1E5_9HYPH|nr:hypothetical protein [Methylobacterium trifolii]GJE61289.1 hypothetical protein MPOCJGCO_3410 [Methylobacterium trifolii]